MSFYAARSITASRSVCSGDFAQQPFGLLLQFQNVSAELGQRAELRRLVEVAGEADLVADLRIGLDDPGVGSVWQDFAADEGFDAAFLQQRDLLEVAYRAGISINPKSSWN